jgi:hypothetical protein
MLQDESVYGPSAEILVMSRKDRNPVVGPGGLLLGESEAVPELVAASMLNVSVHTLRRWRALRKGPNFIKYPGAKRRGRGSAGRVAYRVGDVLAFQAEMTVPTENPSPESG